MHGWSTEVVPRFDTQPITAGLEHAEQLELPLLIRFGAHKRLLDELQLTVLADWPLPFELHAGSGDGRARIVHHHAVHDLAERVDGQIAEIGDHALRQARERHRHTARWHVVVEPHFKPIGRDLVRSHLVREMEAAQVIGDDIFALETTGR